MVAASLFCLQEDPRGNWETSFTKANLISVVMQSVSWCTPIDVFPLIFVTEQFTLLVIVDLSINTTGSDFHTCDLLLKVMIE